MNKVEFYQKNVIFLVSPGTYWSTCYVKNLKILSFSNYKNMMKLWNQENYLITKLCIQVRDKLFQIMKYY